MAAELRWILAGLSILLLAGIWWWGARRSRQAPGNAELRESPKGSAAPPLRAPVPVSMEDESDPQEFRAHPSSRDWGVSPLEPLSIRTADFEPVQIVDLPMTAHSDPLKESFDLGVFEHEIEASELATMQADEVESMAPRPPPATLAPAPAASGESGAVATSPQVPNVSETQRIVTIRVCAGESHWAGLDLMTALEKHGLAYGRYNVFHRKHSDGRTLFCAASLIEPGTFNIAQMPQEQYRGLTLFAVLPGPCEPLQTLDAIIETAGELAETLRGTVQDSKGLPLSQQGAEALREDVARFQASLTMR